jgi:hypothetical protein
MCIKGRKMPAPVSLFAGWTMTFSFGQLAAHLGEAQMIFADDRYDLPL